VSIAFLFPGQGSQFPGMLDQLLDHPEVERTLEEVSSVLHTDVRDLDSEEALKSTVSVQLVVLTAGVATGRALIEKSVLPAVVCGLSVGAFAAAVIADVLSFEDAVELVQMRAERTIELYPTGYGLSAIVGLNESQVLKIVRAVTSEREPVFIANINAPRQIVIVGSDEVMENTTNPTVCVNAITCCYRTEVSLWQARHYSPWPVACSVVLRRILSSSCHEIGPSLPAA
jgi:malonate decarboxylase epsilon subunit